MSRKSAAARDLPVLPHREWNDLFGFGPIQTRLRQLLEEQRCPQVLLFEGREGIGKRKLLAYFCGLLACENQVACGRCDSCRSVQNGLHPDLLWIEADGAIKVADADRIQQHLAYRASGSWQAGAERLVVIVDIESMTEQAANRLLKTLEEPPPDARIILSCSRPRQLLATIASRLVRWHLPVPEASASLEWLAARLPAAAASDLDETLRGQGLSPGLALQKLSAMQEQSELIKRVEALLMQPQANQELQDCLKQLGWKAPVLAQHCELLLNRSYKRSLDKSSLSRELPRIALLRHRRRILQQIYRAGGSDRNHLNTLMAAEAWASQYEEKA